MNVQLLRLLLLVVATFVWWQAMDSEWIFYMTPRGKQILTQVVLTVIYMYLLTLAVILDVG